jgi:hypothetical protein
MVSRARIERLSSRVDALAAHAVFGGQNTTARGELARRIDAIAKRLQAIAEERGEPFPPPLSGEEHRRVLEFLGLQQR